MTKQSRLRGRLFLAVALFSLLTPTVVLAAEDTFATFEGCVFDRQTGRPIEGALIFVQSLGSANGGGSTTGPDGCVSGMLVNTELFPGDYIEASFEHNRRRFLQQYRIPNRLIEQTYRYDFFLDISP